MDTGAPFVDTEIQLSNTSGQFIKLRCFYVNANSHCSNDFSQICNTILDCPIGGGCVPGWLEIDFEISLTPYQPLIWKVSTGMPVLPLGLAGAQQGNIPPANEDPFYGELKCIEVDFNNEPVNRNDLKGEVSIITVSNEILDARAYNAIGIQATEAVNPDNVLVLGE